MLAFFFMALIGHSSVSDQSTDYHDRQCVAMLSALPEDLCSAAEILQAAEAIAWLEVESVHRTPLFDNQKNPFWSWHMQIIGPTLCGSSFGK